MSNRKAATAFYVEFLTDFFGNEKPALWHKEHFMDKLTDNQFAQLMDRMEAGNEFMPVLVPNLDSEVSVNVERNIALGKKLGVEFFHHLRLTDQVTGAVYETPRKYLVCLLPIRRQAQTLEKKASIPDDNRHINEMTGQATGVSKGSSVSFPELQVLHAQGFNDAILEMIKFRGGDTVAFQAMDKIVTNTGSVSLNQLSKLGTEVKATTTLRTYFRCMHLEPIL